MLCDVSRVALDDTILESKCGTWVLVEIDILNCIGSVVVRSINDLVLEGLFNS